MAEFDVVCSECKYLLENEFISLSSVLRISPCEKCLEEARKEGYKEREKEGEGL